MKIQSVTEYANDKGLTRQAILIQIKQKRLPNNVQSMKVGKTWVLRVADIIQAS